MEIVQGNKYRRAHLNARLSHTYVTIFLMPEYKQASKRGLFDPDSDKPFKISRSKIDLFHNCPRCFYLDRRLATPRTGFPAFTLNSAVDHLLKKEFDIHRKNKEPHPIMIEHKVDAVPFEHEDLNKWRHNFTGVQVLHKPTNFLVFGAVDDVWISNKNGQLHVVDYKATSKNDKPNLDGYWQQGYKRQMEVYQWLLRENSFDVSDVGYFVYANGRKDMDEFDSKLEFDVDLIEYSGNTDWIEPMLKNIKKVLLDSRIPSSSDDCEYCGYREAVRKAIAENGKAKDKDNENTLF